MKNTEQLVDELTESFINGNKSFVIAEISKLSTELAMFVCVKVYVNLYSNDSDHLKDEAGRFLFLLWAKAPNN